MLTIAYTKPLLKKKLKPYQFWIYLQTYISHANIYKIGKLQRWVYLSFQKLNKKTIVIDACRNKSSIIATYIKWELYNF